MFSFLYQLVSTSNNKHQQLAKTFDIKILYGEPIKLEGYDCLTNKITRSQPIYWSLLKLPFTVLAENIRYFILPICNLLILPFTNLWHDNKLSVIFSVLIPFIILAVIQFTLELNNFIGIYKLDQEINNLEANILLPWDECINSKDLLQKVKDKAERMKGNPDVREARMQTFNNISKMVSQKLLSKQVSVVAKDQDLNSRKQALNKQISIQQINMDVAPILSSQKMGQEHKQESAPASKGQPSKAFIKESKNMAPLMNEDQKLRLELQQKLEATPEIQYIQKKLPKLFAKDHARQRLQTQVKSHKEELDEIQFSSQILSSQIQVGDLVILNQNEMALCDLVIINASDGQFLIQEQLCEYNQLSMRSPLLFNKVDTQNIGYFKRNLAASIQIKIQQGQINGYFQLKNDPHSENISLNNIILRKQRLIKTHWVIGIAFRVGNECLSQSEIQNKPQQSLIIKNAENMSTLFIVLAVGFQIANIIFIYLTDYQEFYYACLFMNISQLLLMFPYVFKFTYYLINILSQLLLDLSKVNLNFKLFQQFTLDQYSKSQVITFQADHLIEKQISIISMTIKGLFYELDEQNLDQAVVQVKQSMSASQIIQSESVIDQSVPNIKSKNRVSIQHLSLKKSTQIKKSSDLDLEYDVASLGLDSLRMPSDQIKRFILPKQSQILDSSVNQKTDQFFTHHDGGPILTQAPLIQHDQLKPSKTMKQRSSKALGGSNRDINIPKRVVKYDNNDLANKLAHDSRNFMLLQFALNHLTWSKLLITEKAEKIKNYNMNVIDDKQIKFAKIFDYEFIATNNHQKNLEYLVKINEQVMNFRLVDNQIQFKSQRLIQLFELPKQIYILEQEFVLFIREANSEVQAKQFDKNSQNQQSSSHQIKYSYCVFKQSEADEYLEEINNIQANYTNYEDLLIQTYENFIVENCIIMIDYDPKKDCKDLIQHINHSDKQIVLHSNECFIKTLSIAYATGIVNKQDSTLLFNNTNEEDLRAQMKKNLAEFITFFPNPSTIANLSPNNQQFQNSQQLILSGEIPSKALFSEQDFEEIVYNKQIQVILSQDAFIQICENSYLFSHLKLMLLFAKNIILYEFHDKYIHQFMEAFPTNRILQILHDEQVSLELNKNTQIIQLIKLKQFIQPLKIEFPREKSKFFGYSIEILKFKLLQQRYYFNKLFIQSNAAIILNSLGDLKVLLFQLSPIYKLIFHQMLLLTIRRFTLYFLLTQVVSLHSGLQNMGLFNYFIESIYFMIINQMILYLMICLKHQFLFRSKQNSINLDLLIILILKQQDKLVQVLNIIFNTFFAYFVVLFPGESDVETKIALPFFIININDIIYNLIDLKLNHQILLIILYVSSYILYLTNTNEYDYDQYSRLWNIEHIFAVIVCIMLSVLSDYICSALQSYDFTIIQQPEQFYRYISSDTTFRISLHNINNMVNNRFYVRRLESNIEKIFNSIDQADFILQKFLSSFSEKQDHNFKKWQSEIFNKAKSIMKWSQRFLYQSIISLILLSNCYWSVFDSSNIQLFPFITYILYVGFQILIILAQIIQQQSQKVIQKIVLVKFLTNAIVLFLACLNIFNIDNIIYLSAIFALYQCTQKFYPIYNMSLYIIIIFSILILYVVVFIAYHYNGILHYLANIILVITITVQQYLVKNYMTYLEEDQAINQINFILENGKINDILSILLPKFIRNRLNETDEYNIQQNVGNVAILFCDLCDFDKVIIEEQDNVVIFLDQIFRQFDKLCTNCGLQKIETVGKTYLATAGLKACEIDLNYLAQIEPVQRTLNLAEQMMDFIESRSWGKNNKSLVGKIGIHYGSAIAGVIGFHKPQFSLIGDTVNTTSRVCSTGLDGRITLSEAAFAQIKNDQLSFDERPVEMKGLGQRPTYVLIRIKGRQSVNIQEESVIRKATMTTRKTIIKKQQHQQQQEQQRKQKPQKKTIIDHLNQPASNTKFNDDNKIASKASISYYRNSIHQLNQNFQQYGEDQELRQKSASSHQLSRTQAHQFPQAQGVQGIVKTKPSSYISALAKEIKHPISIQSYNPEIKKVIDYELLFNVISLKHQSNIEVNNIHELSVKQVIQTYSEGARNPQMNQYFGVIQMISSSLSRNQQKLFLIYYFMKQFVQIANYNYIYLPLIILQWLTLALLIAKELMIFKNFLTSHHTHVFKIIYALIFIISPIHYFNDQENLSELHFMEAVLIQSILCSHQAMYFHYKIILCALSCIYQIIMISASTSNLWLIYFYILFTLLNAIFAYYLEQQQVQSFNQKQIYEVQQKKESQLIEYLLPTHILKQYLTNDIRQKNFVDKIESLTILFADIAGFTEYSAQVEAEQVLKMLKNLFVQFDRKSKELNVYKLYTIGDCYVAIGMNDYEQRNYVDEAKNVLNLAFEMIDIIEQVKREIKFDGLTMRIGIHTSKDTVIGGVMGTDIVRYDIYGPDVLIANKMESNGKKGYIQVSTTTKELLEQTYPDDYVYEHNCNLKLTSIQREIDGYLVFKNYAEEEVEEEEQSVLNSDQQ